MQEKISQHINQHIEVFQQVVPLLVADIERCAQLMCQALRNGNKILVMGNGGSAADAQHFAAELVGRFLKNRAALPAIALTTDTSILTAVANDFGYEQVFSRQVEALANAGDVVVGISTSGNSANVQLALNLAHEQECHTVAFLGRDGGIIAPQVDLALTVAVNDTPRIQEVHLTLIHILCDLIESDLFVDN
ncbi:MAG: D-sedoheptulose 7-phosphate isomerase [Thermodesulfobacteriota bacterium]|nr:D-sedoheptulose 7-phosphate isomerase [Thermodesulfobacteriota bacterium]